MSVLISDHPIKEAMKTQIYSLFIGLAVFAGVHPVSGQETRFFRISGPAATKITAFRLDGTMVWTNATPGTNYIVQTVSSQPGETNWVDYVQLPVTNFVNTNWIIDPNPPTGMALVPAGSFQMGDSLDGESDAPVHTVYVSAFYMDQTDVTEALVAAGLQLGGAITDTVLMIRVRFMMVTPRGRIIRWLTLNWYDCVKWCNARSEMEGRTPAYYTSAAQTIGVSDWGC